MNKHLAFTTLILISLLFSLSMVALPVKAQKPLNITIKPDGSVESSTYLLERNGTTYTFKGDIFGTIWVQTNNIILDGSGHTLNGNGMNTGQNTEIGILLGGPDLSQRECTAVLVENLRIYNIPTGIFSIGGSNNSFISNYFDKSSMEIQGNANGTGDLIKHNNLVNTTVLFDLNPNGTDIITENNFANSTIYLALSNAPIVDKNYWNNYTAKYPDENQLGTEIWDTPYVYGTFLGVNSSIDYHPSVNPITDFEITQFNPGLTPSPTLQTSAPSMPLPTATVPEFPIQLLIVAFVGFAIIVFSVSIIAKKNTLGL